jgi:thiol-disulfide isomerase/thioredoxin
MKLRPLSVIVSLLLLLATSPLITATTPPEDRWLYGSSGYARALELQREMKVPLVVYFYTDWCPYCHALDSDYLPSAPVQQYLRGVVKVRINPEHGPAEREIAKQYGVNGYPSFFIVRNPSSTPVDIQPFRRGGKNLTPTEWVSACQKAESFSTRTTINRSTIKRTTTPASASVKANISPTRQKLKAQIVEAPPAPATNANLPTLDAVLAKYVAAIGGQAAQRRITSRVSKGRVDVPGVSFGGKLEVYAKAPNKSLTVMNVEPVGLMKEGFDGRTSWSVAGNNVNAGNELDHTALADADFYREIQLAEIYSRIKLVGKRKESFRDVYVVEATPKGGSAESLYFDVETGLLVRRDFVRETARGPVRAEVYFNDWREIDGVKLPFKVTQVMPNMKFVITFEEVKQNVPVDEAIFRRP